MSSAFCGFAIKKLRSILLAFAEGLENMDLDIFIGYVLKRNKSKLLFLLLVTRNKVKKRLNQHRLQN